MDCGDCVLSLAGCFAEISLLIFTGGIVLIFRFTLTGVSAIFGCFFDMSGVRCGDDRFDICRQIIGKRVHVVWVSMCQGILNNNIW